MYRIIDVETTGLSPQEDKVLSVGVLSFDTNYNIVKKDIFYFWADDYVIKPDAYEINHLSREMLESHKDEFDKNLEDLYTLLNNTICYSKSTGFDINFITQLFTQYGKGFAIPTIHHCSLYDYVSPVFKRITGKSNKGNIEEWFDAFKINRYMDNVNLHDALYDCLVEFYCFREAEVCKVSEEYYKQTFGV